MVCRACNETDHWSWTEAFAKFGFNDGDGHIKTWKVADALVRDGYSLSIGKWGTHNIIIYSLRKHGLEHIPDALSDYVIGYDDPQAYLPEHILKLLDQKFPRRQHYVFQN